MAQIEITPLNISGVKIPFNLLDNLLGQKIDYTNLVYPMDLATNPQYCHAIQFSIHDYDYATVDALFEKVSGVFDKFGLNAKEIFNALNIPSLGGNFSASGVVGSIANALSSGWSSISNANLPQLSEQAKGAATGAYNYNVTPDINQFIGKLNNIKNMAPGEVRQFLTDYKPLIDAISTGQDSAFRKHVKETKLASVSLYLPDTLQTQFDSNYSDVSLTNTFGIVGYGANVLSDAMNRGALDETNKTNIINSDYRKGAVAGIAGAMTGKDDITALFQNALKRVPNPQVQLLYRGLELRRFSFDFTFTPSSSKEAEEIDQIIKTFIYYSLPDLSAGSGGQYFIPPQVFRIKFAFLGKADVSGQIYDVFKNSVNNFLGNQFTKILTGSNPTNDIASKSARIFQIGDCVLENVSVNYAPNGWASYQDGYPIQTSMSLTFREMDLVNKTTPGIAPKNTKNYFKSGSGSQSVGAEVDFLGSIL